MRTSLFDHTAKRQGSSLFYYFSSPEKKKSRVLQILCRDGWHICDEFKRQRLLWRLFCGDFFLLKKMTGTFENPIEKRKKEKKEKALFRTFLTSSFLVSPTIVHIIRACSVTKLRAKCEARRGRICYLFPRGTRRP